MNYNDMTPEQREAYQKERQAVAEKLRRLHSATHSVSSIDKIPDHAHFAILTEEAMTYNDGYGEHGRSSYSTHNYLSYVYFDSDEALQAWIVENHQKKKFKVLSVKGVTFELKTTISVRE